MESIRQEQEGCREIAVTAIQTPIFRAGQSLERFVAAHVPRQAAGERAIVVVTSKIASVAEGRMVPRAAIDKASLVRREADRYLGETRFGVALTIKNSLLIPSAGIDESNSESGDFILYPARPFESAARLWAFLRAEWGLRELGVILSDSRVLPLRRGVVGVALSYWGFRGVRSLVGRADLFGRELKVTQMNLADGLAAMAVMAMGEGAERRPLASIRGAEVEFADEIESGEMSIPLEEDLFGSLIGGGGNAAGL
jgi:F420-0:gamma-glutamyl ligase